MLTELNLQAQRGAMEYSAPQLKSVLAVAVVIPSLANLRKAAKGNHHSPTQRNLSQCGYRLKFGSSMLNSTSEPMVRLTNGQGSDEANIYNCSFKIRPDGSFIVPKHIGDILTSDGHSGFREEYDDAATLAEIRLLASVLTGHQLRAQIEDLLTGGALQ
jgi:hypothetical protein